MGRKTVRGYHGARDGFLFYRCPVILGCKSYSVSKAVMCAHGLLLKETIYSVACARVCICVHSNVTAGDLSTIYIIASIAFLCITRDGSFF